MEKLRILISVCVATSLTGCGVDRLNSHVQDEGTSAIEFVNKMVVKNIAKARYFERNGKSQDFLPADYHVTAGQQVTNDSFGITPGGTFGAAHGIVAPTVSIPMSESLQQQLNFGMTTDAKLLRGVEAIYLREMNNPIFHDGALPPGKSGTSASYMSQQVWVSDDDMGELAKISFDVLGADIPLPGATTPPPTKSGQPSPSKLPSTELYNLRLQQQTLQGGLFTPATPSIAPPATH